MIKSRRVSRIFKKKRLGKLPYLHSLLWLGIYATPCRSRTSMLGGKDWYAHTLVIHAQLTANFSKHAQLTPADSYPGLIPDPANPKAIPLLGFILWKCNADGSMIVIEAFLRLVWLHKWFFLRRGKHVLVFEHCHCKKLVRAFFLPLSTFLWQYNEKYNLREIVENAALSAWYSHPLLYLRSAINISPPH